jgi:hypothetical protein
MLYSETFENWSGGNISSLLEHHHCALLYIKCSSFKKRNRDVDGCLFWRLIQDFRVNNQPTDGYGNLEYCVTWGTALPLPSSLLYQVEGYWTLDLQDSVCWKLERPPGRSHKSCTCHEIRFNIENIVQREGRYLQQLFIISLVVRELECVEPQLWSSRCPEPDDVRVKHGI